MSSYCFQNIIRHPDWYEKQGIRVFRNISPILGEYYEHFPTEGVEYKISP